MLTSDLYAKHMLPAKPGGECSDSDSAQRDMPKWILRSHHLSLHSHAHVQAHQL